MMMMMILVYLRSHQLDNYKDRSPGLHMWTPPPLVPTSPFLVGRHVKTRAKMRHTWRYALVLRR